MTEQVNHDNSTDYCFKHEDRESVADIDATYETAERDIKLGHYELCEDCLAHFISISDDIDAVIEFLNCESGESRSE